MGWFKAKKSKTPTPTPSINTPQPYNVPKNEVILSIPGSKVYLMDEGEAIELASGEFTLVRIVEDQNILLATIVRVGDDLQWPLTKDEPVVKLDPLHYLFSLPVKDGKPLSYGVSFSDPSACGVLDNFVSENACFSATSASSTTSKKEIDWKEYAPKVEAYNDFLSKAIAGGTGQIVRGIFMCSNAYANQVQKGGEMILTQGVDENNNDIAASNTKGDSKNAAAKTNAINKNIKRVRKLSHMTERMSKTVLNGVEMVAGKAVAPAAQSRAGKTLLKLPPAQVILASFAALDAVLDAAEAASKQALTATSGAATGMVSQRFGENAGEATGDAIATAGHCVCTCWNIFKIRKVINPATAVNSGFKNAAKTAAKNAAKNATKNAAKNAVKSRL